MNELERAVVNNNHTLVETLLANGADPNIPGHYSFTPLHLAARHGHHSIVKILLANRADPDLKNDIDGHPALQYAAEGGHLDVFETLLPKTHKPDWNRLLQAFSHWGWKDKVKEALARGAKPNKRHPPYEDTALILAAAAGKNAVVEILIDKGADPNIFGRNHFSPLHIAALNGHHTVVQTLLDKGADPNQRNRGGCAAVELSAWGGHLHVYDTLLPRTHRSNLDSLLTTLSALGWKDQVEALLDKGADPNNDKSAGYTPLVKAIAAGHLDIVKILLARKANPNAKTRLADGWVAPNVYCHHPPLSGTPVLQAVRDGQHDIVKILLVNGADPNISEKPSESPLYLAAEAEDYTIVETLLANGAGVDKEIRRAALQHAADTGHFEAFKTLLPETDQLDWDRLLLAFSYCGWKDQVEVALAKGANPNKQHHADRTTPLQLAAKAGHHTIVETLLANGADPNVPGKYNYTPLVEAVALGCLPIVETLLANGANPELKKPYRPTALCLAKELDNDNKRVSIYETIQNFVSIPRTQSLKSCCRASIRSRLIENMNAGGMPLKQAIYQSLPLPATLKSYVHQPLSL